mmetsp:Transcript_42003/g.96458  ORF Transcript_42003/g.96458 Transcript_42003/m.96458 type:complete len:286 (+) Transcript_42003:71-928(+)
MAYQAAPAAGGDMFGQAFGAFANFAAKNPQAAQQAAQQGYQFAQQNPEMANAAMNAGVQQAAGQNQGGFMGMFGGAPQQQQQQQQQGAPAQTGAPPQQGGSKPGLFGMFGGSKSQPQQQLQQGAQGQQIPPQYQQQWQNMQNQAGQYGTQAQQQAQAAGQQLQAQGASAQQQASGFFGSLFGAGAGMFTSPEQQAAQNYGGTLMQFGDVLEKYKKGDLKKEDAKSQCDVLMKQLETYGEVDPALVDQYLRTHNITPEKRAWMRDTYEEVNKDTSCMGRVKSISCC